MSEFLQALGHPYPFTPTELQVCHDVSAWVALRKRQPRVGTIRAFWASPERLVALARRKGHPCVRGLQGWYSARDKCVVVSNALRAGTSAFARTLVHEFTHRYQDEAGSLRTLPLEALESDARAMELCWERDALLARDVMTLQSPVI